MPSVSLAHAHPVFTSALLTVLTELLGKEVLVFLDFTGTFWGILGPYWLILCLSHWAVPASPVLELGSCFLWL